MKRALLLLLIVFCSSIHYSQRIYHNYIDGKIYLKVDRAQLNQVINSDFRNVPVNKIPILNALKTKYGITRVMRPFFQANDDPTLPYILRVEFSKIWLVRELIEELEKDRAVTYAEKVPLCKTDVVPNEGLLTHLSQINAANAWNVYNGNSNITVAIVDNAVMWTHADLVQNTYTNTAETPGNGIDDDGNGYIDDVNGYDVSDWDNNTIPSNNGMDHGTHCAGVAAGRTDNNMGIASIGWNVKFIPVKCQTNTGSPSVVADGFPGILYAVKAKARIISCSFGNSGSSLTEQTVIDYAWNRGCIVIASAGNNGTSVPNYPGAYNNVYCVAAVDPSDVRWSLSSYGTWVDIAAPGTNILSTVPYSGTPAYFAYSGTSMATPMVAGLAALMLSKSPNMTRMDVLNCISSTAVNISTLSGNSGYNLGAGRIEAFAAMNCAATFSAIPPIANFYTYNRYTCPNSNVQFYDSSLYAPTVWSWSFQNGTPATSTATNPVVQWTTPGTYSVMLTVSNANGTNSTTKLLYITVAGALPLPFFEGFEAPAFLPPNWSPVNLWNDNIYWERRASLGAWGTSTACSVFDNYTYNVANERDEMRSPKFNFSNVAAARIRFDVAYARYNANYPDTLEVKLSTNCGSTWTSFYLKGNSTLATAPDILTMFTPSPTQWRTDSTDISTLTAGQGNVMFSFINRGHYGQPIYLDNINLAFPIPTLNVTVPASVCVNSPLVLGGSAVAAASYTYNFQGASSSTSSILNPTISFASPGVYTLSLSGTNGTSTTSITRTITVVPLPILSVTSATICAGGTATLSANGASSYLWTDGVTQSIGGTFISSPGVTTTYTVVGNNGVCNVTTTTSIFVTTSTVVVTISSSTSTLCAGSPATLTASGASQYNWQGGANTATIVVTPTTSTNYTVTGMTASCGGTAAINLSVAAVPTVTYSLANTVCFGQCNGGYTVSNTSGSAPFTFSVNGPCNSATCSNLCSGNYTLVTTDAIGCKSSNTFSILDPAPVLAVINGSNGISCASCQDGSISLSPTGGNAPYTYSWSPNVSNTFSASGLPASCYTITVSDASNCSTSTVSCLFFATAIAGQSHTEFMIYPNPSQGEVTIETGSTPCEVKIYSMQGQFLYEQKELTGTQQLLLKDYAKGIYLLQVKRQEQERVLKLVIQ